MIALFSGKISLFLNTITLQHNFLRFPNDRRQEKEWLEVVKRNRPDFVLSKFSYICSDHFKKNDIIGAKKKYLKPNSSMIDKTTNVDSI
jgi:hypothetical protein